METKLASPDVIELSSMFLGPPPDNFSFVPKHKAAAHVPVQGAPVQTGANEDEENG